MRNLIFSVVFLFCTILSYAHTTTSNNALMCEVTYTVSGTTVTIQNLDAPISTAKIFDANFSQIFNCDNFGGTPCMDTETISLPGPGTYFISVQTLTDFASPPICDFFETIEVTAAASCDRNTNPSAK